MPDAEATEREIRALCDAERWPEAATLWVETHGPDVLTFLVALHGRVDPHEVFSQFCEDLWRSLPTFRWGCSTSTWSYRLARNAWHRALKHTLRRGQPVPLSAAPQVHDAAQRVRSSTALHQRTDVKDQFVALREELSSDDQMLLILRVDRDLPWTEVAEVMIEEGATAPGDLDRVTVRVRKQFQRVKNRLRDLAHARGLLPPG